MNIFLEDLLKRHPELQKIAGKIEQAAELIISAYEQGHRLYLCGNGGSAADSEHIVGELMKGFILKRPVGAEFQRQLQERYGEEGEAMAARLQGGLPAISLTGAPALSSAFSNDVAAEMVFAQQIFVMGQPGDVLVGITTSGNSKNVVNALKIAAVKGLKTIALTGEGGGKCAELVDCLVNVPARETFLVQEYHLPVYHTLCLMIEDRFYGSQK